MKKRISVVAANNAMQVPGLGGFEWSWMLFVKQEGKMRAHANKCDVGDLLAGVPNGV